MVLRPAIPGDANALTALAHRAKASWGYPPEWLAAWRDDLTISEAYLSAHRGYVAELHGRLAGVLVLEDHGDHWSLEHVWIDPDMQRKGLGRLLVQHALKAAGRHRPARVHVLSDPHAESFYTQLGAVRVGTHPAPMPGTPDRVLPMLEFNLQPGPA